VPSRSKAMVTPLRSIRPDSFAVESSRRFG
jgi:hypothetical protein